MRRLNEILSWLFIIALLTFAFLKHFNTPKVEQVAPITVEEVKQQVMLDQVKQAEGHSVLIRTEKIGDDVKPLTVRHYARLSETGEIVYWTEVIDDQPPD